MRKCMGYHADERPLFEDMYAEFKFCQDNGIDIFNLQRDMEEQNEVYSCSRSKIVIVDERE